ncbi:MAG: 1,4-beta-D-glucan glucohydrolase [Novosphingobium sp. 17-62-19]|uniref:glycoside hydrolase family 3 protein n=1 Tax=Novosphingobium sp. 17-62-19 TaxID=1970406 RepID=UPI000BDB0DE6|nr:glycoside hydrolase family 3 protein [Novosphingobium sp. 17-62-19]OZA18553.1 MAG: 1,4-beta-D-glucan glucohydrolase [Novosphingobium sp. 17-62-19]HQS97726.1 glycoside hydrolase family 3 N-terminal domain-containing protein [Novosphingobium sp.]
MSTGCKTHAGLLVLPLLLGTTALNAQGSGTADPAKWPIAQSPSAITSPKTEREIDRLISKMTLEQKVGQVIQGDISAMTPSDLERYPLGSILAGGNSGPYGDERADAAKWLKLVQEYRAASRKAGAGIPILFGVDAVHGHSNVPGATIFPHNIGLGAAHDPDLIRRIGEATAEEISATGIEWTFAPTLAVPQDLRWGRAYEGYSSDPKVIAAYSPVMVEALQGRFGALQKLPANKVAASAKHFLADGGTAGGKDQGDAQISEEELVRIHAAGYAPAIDAGALTVMASFSSWNGVKNHGNRSLLTDVLKKRMGFEGLVVGDWNGHGQIPGCTPTDCAAAINAGLDLYMAPDSWKALYDNTLKQARDGTIPMARLEDAVRRNLRVKFKLGLMGKTPVERGNPAMLGADKHLEVAREAVAKSLVLLKNEGSVLPIRAGANVLLTGPGADSMAMQAGGWTITWQGTDTSPADFPKGRTIGRAIVDAVNEAGGKAEIAAVPGAAKPDVAVVVFGEQPYAEFQGDVSNLMFQPQSGELELIKSLKEKGIPVVAVFLSGRPMFVGKAMNLADAFVAAWQPGSQGQGVADVLVSGRDGRPKRDFTGTLSFDWPQDARAPMIDPLFKVGHGLSYARPGKVGPVNEDPRVDLGPALSETTYIRAGKVIDPWRLGLDSVVMMRAVDVSAQEDGRQFTWAGKGAFALDGPPIDVQRQVNGGFVLRLDWRLDARGSGPVTASFGGVALDVSALLPAAGQTGMMRIPLTCFAAHGAKVAAIGQPLRLGADKGFVVSIRNAGIEGVGEAIACPSLAK